MEFLKFGVAVLPILWLMFSLGVLRLPAYKTCSATLIATLAIAIFGWWQMPVVEAVGAALEGGALALWPIMIVIIAAVFTYNLSIATGSMEIIKGMLSSITTDRRILVLIIAWGFGGFLEGVAGYGTAVAIPASILSAMGFNPLFASIICLVANTVPTAFGAIGIPVTTIASVTGLPVTEISFFAASQLTPFIILITFLLVMLTEKSVRGVKGVFFITLMSGISFAVPQLLVARYLGAELPCLAGSVSSMAVTTLIAKTMYRHTSGEVTDGTTSREKFIAWLPYILIFVFIILCSSLFPAIKGALGSIKTTVAIYGDHPFTFKWIATPGTLIILATFIGGMLQGESFGRIGGIFVNTCRQLALSAVTVVAIVAMAKVMAYSGMINTIAVVVANVTGSFFPLISPMIGALGTFVTGSDTSSNVLFGKLQLEIARQIGVDPRWLVAASAGGATAGKMISPQSIAVATAATGLIGSEGEILGQTVKVCIGYLMFYGVLTYAAVAFGLV